MSDEKKSLKSQVNYTDTMRAIEKQFRLTSGGLDKEAINASRVSTGLLMYDLVFGGGIIHGWYTMYGGEGAAKSTFIQTLMAASLRMDVPVIQHWDYEQAMDPGYLAGILSAMLGKDDIEAEMRELMGVRNPKTGKYSVAPRVYYYPADVGEEFYKAVGAMLRRLPDKLPVNGTWYYVWDNTREGQAAAKAAGGHDKKLFTETGRLWVKAEDGGRLQGILFLDSYQAMNPEDQEDDDPHNGMAQDARMHAAHIKKVKGKLRRKNVAVIGVSQIRHNPGARFGNPEYITGGNALKHACDCRVKQTERAIPHGKGMIEVEPSVLVEGAEDTYKYIALKNEKNKFSTPYVNGWMRVWIDHEGQGRGFCPAYDTFMYLKATGRIEGKVGTDEGEIPKKFNLNFEEVKLKNLSWLDFKALILLHGLDLKEHCEGLGIKKNPKIRERCMEELLSGVGMDLFHELRVGGASQDASESEDDEDDDDDDDEDLD